MTDTETDPTLILARRLPLTMSIPLVRAVEAREAGNYRDALTRILDFFEMSVQWVNCYFLALARTVPGAGSLKGVERAVRMIDGKRPLSFGDSVNELFHPLLDAMTRVVPEHPLVVSLTANVKNRKKDVLVGSARERGIVKIRNDYKGHSTSLSQAIYAGVLEEIAPRIKAMLAGLEPLAEATVCSVTAAGTVMDLHGSRTPAANPPAAPVPGHYYVGFDGFPTADLFPLAIDLDDKYIYIFQTLKDEKVKYETSDENVAGFETEDYNAAFDAFLQTLVPSFDIAKEANWQELCEAMRAHSARHMVQVQKEKKYSADLFVDRAHLSDLLERFGRSEATLLPLAGDAGQGKTNQICYWTEKFLRQGRPVLVFNGAGFSDAPLEDTLKAIFGISSRRPLKRVLDHLHAQADAAGSDIFIFVDAVNECLNYRGASANAPAALYADLLRAFADPAYRRFKLVSTCRSYTWKNQILPAVDLAAEAVFSEGEEATVSGFTDAETERAYANYKTLYQMTTDYAEIDRRVKLRLRDPLVMKFVGSNYIGERLSGVQSDFSSLALFTKMVDDIGERSFAGHLQFSLLMEISRIFLLSYLRGAPVGSLSVDAVRDALDEPESPLHKLATLIFRDSGISVAYAELCNKPDRPVLRESEKTVEGRTIHSIEFIYERFLEYMLARAFLVMNHGADRTQALPAKTYVDALGAASINVVFIGAMRNALLMEILRTGDLRPLFDLVTDYSENPGVMQLVNETFEMLIRENFEGTLVSILGEMLASRPDDRTLIPRYNLQRKLVADNKATSDTIRTLNELQARLAPTVRLRDTATVAVSNMLLSDYFNEDLYTCRPLDMLWSLVMDDIEEVGNETCKQIYYLSRSSHTSGHTPLRENLTQRIVHEMFADIRSRTIAGNVAAGTARRRAMTFVETGARLATLLIIDATTAAVQDREMISDMLAEIRGIASYFTWRYRLVRLAMPFLQTLMRKQITFQSDYVNNAVEYQGYWNPEVVPAEAPEGQWSRPRLKEAMDFVDLFNRFGDNPDSAECRAALEEFRRFVPVMISAYGSGCAFTYFIMERINIIAGCLDWEAVKPVYDALLAPGGEDFEWADYLRMSLMYSLLQIQVNSKEDNAEILEIYAREAREWTLRCRGLFKARHSFKANPRGLYKRNVMNWYCVAYSCHSGDNTAHPGDSRPVPVLYELIDQAVATADKDLMFHLLENLSELVGDFGYVRTALAAVKYIMEQYPDRESVARLDKAATPSGRYRDETLERAIGQVLSTAKTYFPAETDAFLRSDIVGLKFPGVENYNEEILNFHPGGETLADLFTHKFGNFLLWALLNEQEVDDFAREAVCAAIPARDAFAWFDQVIRILCRRMFNVDI